MLINKMGYLRKIGKREGDKDEDTVTLSRIGKRGGEDWV